MTQCGKLNLACKNYLAHMEQIIKVKKISLEQAFLESKRMKLEAEINQLQDLLKQFDFQVGLYIE